jgi:hypothetical protein
VNDPAGQPPKGRRPSRLSPTVLLVEDGSHPHSLEKPFTRSQLRVALEQFLPNAQMVEE